MSANDPSAFYAFGAGYPGLIAQLDGLASGSITFINDEHTAHEIYPWRKDYMLWRFGLGADPGSPP